MTMVPVGSYRVVADTTIFGDSLRMFRPGGIDLTGQAGDTATAVILLGYPSATVADARNLNTGRKVVIEGIALNGWATFGDATVHLADATGSIRAVNVGSAFIFAGDSIRLVGMTSMRDGQVVLNSVSPSVLGRSQTPPSVSASTSVAAAANAGRWDAALVRVERATITDTASVGGDFRLTVNDGSGPLQLLLYQSTGISRGPYTPGITIDASGLLVPLPGGTTWRLVPRTREDLVVR